MRKYIKLGPRKWSSLGSLKFSQILKGVQKFNWAHIFNQGQSSFCLQLFISPQLPLTCLFCCCYCFYPPKMSDLNCFPKNCCFPKSMIACDVSLSFCFFFFVYCKINTFSSGRFQKTSLRMMSCTNDVFFCCMLKSIITCFFYLCTRGSCFAWVN